MQRHSVLFCLILLVSQCSAQQVTRITWLTSHACPPAVFPRPAGDFLPFFRMALTLLPESNIVMLAFSQPGFLGLSGEDAGRLQSLCGDRNRLINNDPL